MASWLWPSRAAVAICLSAPLVSCASSEAVRLSANTMIIKTSAAPVCGSTGAVRVAQQMAAISTIRAGFDRYIIVDGASQNNVRVTQTPGSYTTTGSVMGNTYYGTTSYQPGPTIVHGSHDQGFQIVMFKDGDPQGAQAIPARDILGADWADKVKNGKPTCF